MKNVAEVNSYLKRFAADPVFQANLKAPNVRVALDLWGGSNGLSVFTDEQLVEIQKDPGVRTMFPLIKEFEAACQRANICFPIGYVTSSRSELDAEALLRIYGPDL